MTETNRARIGLDEVARMTFVSRGTLREHLAGTRQVSALRGLPPPLPREKRSKYVWVMQDVLGWLDSQSQRGGSPASHQPGQRSFIDFIDVGEEALAASGGDVATAVGESPELAPEIICCWLAGNGGACRQASEQLVALLTATAREV